MRDLSNNLLIGLGEVLWDVFDDARQPGGAPANLAFHARQLGVDSAICSRVGTDELGDELIAYLKDRGFDTSTIQRDAAHPTSTVTVQHDDPDAPAYVIHEDVAWDHLELSESWRELLQRARVVCFGTLAQRSPASRSTIQEALALARDATVFYDVNLRPPWYAREVIEMSLRRADVVKLNRDEVETLSHLLELGSTDLRSFAGYLNATYGVEVTCVTRGGEGCAVYRGAEKADLPGRPVVVQDAVGAGDAFSAALITGLLRGWPIAAIADFANRFGGLVAGSAGAMPTLTSEIASLTGQIIDEHDLDAA